MLITYIPAADRAGARIYADCAVRRISAEAGRVRRVEGEVVDALGRTHHRFTVRPQVVVVCAGAINTAALLLQSGIANANGRVGRDLHLHPSVLLSGLYDEDIYGYRGIPQSYYVDEFIDLERDPDSGYILMPVYGFPVMTATQLPGFGRAHFEMMKNYHRMVGILVLMHDQSTGQVQVDRNGRPQITYSVNAEEQQLFADGLKHCAEILFASGATKVIAPYTRPVVLTAGDALDVFAQPRRAPGRHPDRFDPPAEYLRDGRGPQPRRRELLLPIARAAQPVHLRHECLPDLAWRTAADLDRGDCGPHRTVHHGELAEPQSVAPAAVPAAARGAPRTGGGEHPPQRRVDPRRQVARANESARRGVIPGCKLPMQETTSAMQETTSAAHLLLL